MVKFVASYFLAGFLTMIWFKEPWNKEVKPSDAPYISGAIIVIAWPLMLLMFIIITVFMAQNKYARRKANGQ